MSALRTFTRFTISDAATLRRTIAEVRRSRYAVSDRQITDDAYSVAAPVFGADGECVAAVSVVVPADDPNRVAWVPAVCAAARSISRQLTGPAPAAGSRRARRRSS